MVLLGIINFSLVWGLVLAFSLALIVVSFLLSRHHGDESSAHWAKRNTVVFGQCRSYLDTFPVLWFIT